MSSVPSSVPDPFPHDDGEAAPILPEMIVVSVGTDHHPFDRLIDWTVRWAEDHRSVKMVIQRGTAAAPSDMETHELIPHDELRELFSSATVVVSHGGPSTVMDARMAGKYPVVVPRDPAKGEHVDEHQIRFAHHLAKHELARLALTEDEFRAALDDGLNNPSTFSIPRQDATATAGVIRFGEVVDDLLGIKTRIRFSELDGVEQREADRREGERRNNAGPQKAGNDHD